MFISPAIKPLFLFPSLSLLFSLSLAAHPPFTLLHCLVFRTTSSSKCLVFGSGNQSNACRAAEWGALRTTIRFGVRAIAIHAQRRSRGVILGGTRQKTSASTGSASGGSFRFRSLRKNATSLGRIRLASQNDCFRCAMPLMQHWRGLSVHI